MNTKSRLLVICMRLMVVLSTFTPWRVNAGVASPLAPETNFALRFDGTNDYVTFGREAGLSALGVQGVHHRDLADENRLKADRLDRYRWSGLRLCRWSPRGAVRQRTAVST